MKKHKHKAKYEIVPGTFVDGFLEYTSEKVYSDWRFVWVDEEGNETQIITQHQNLLDPISYAEERGVTLKETIWPFAKRQ